MEAKNTPVGATLDQGLNPERQRLSIRTAAKRLKEEISIEDYLEAHGVAVRHNRAKCLVHGGSNPASFSINPDLGVWHCFACGHGGDLIDLAELVEKHANVWTAVVSLAQQFNVELPRRSDRWHARQDVKVKAREAVRRQITKVYQRRLTRLYTPLVLVGGETPEEELAAIEGLAQALWPICVTLAERRLRDAA